MKLALLDKVNVNREAFGAKIAEIAKLLDVAPEWLMFVMWFESKLKAQAVNPVSNATGLLQWMPATAKDLGTTVEALYNMTNLKQLDYVYRYYKPYKGKMKSFEDVYMGAFFPAAIGKPEDYVLKTSKLPADTVAKANPIFDLDKNKEITIAEIKTVLLNKVPEALQAPLQAAKSAGSSMLLVLLLLFFFIF